LALMIVNLHLARMKKKKVWNKECVVSYSHTHAKCSKLSVHVVWEDRGGNVTYCVMSSTVVPTCVLHTLGEPQCMSMNP
jgi:hypothetical protein